MSSKTSIVKISPIVKLVSMMLKSESDLTPRQDNPYDSSRNYCGSPPRGWIGMTEIVILPQFYDEICYGIYQD